MTQKMSESEKKKEDWMNSKWRPMMGWSYMLTCIADFVIFPVLWSVLQSISKGQVNVQWQPITLQGAGLYHIAMGAIIGVSAYGRTQEKLNGANNGGLPTADPVQVQQPVMMGAGQGVPQSFAPAPQQQYQPAASFAPAPQGDAVKMVNGKKAPVQPDFPEI